jgi:proteasome lid subunit RPN8/RPN11
MLILTPALLQEICHHAQQTYPEECCGILLGYLGPTAEKTLIQAIPTRNAWSEATAVELQAQIAPSRHAPNLARRDRYWIDPGDLLQAQKLARSRNQQIIGIYHSHPDHEALPSEADRRLAWSTYAYLIVSVHQGSATEALCWQLDENGQFEPEALHVAAS